MTGRIAVDSMKDNQGTAPKQAFLLGGRNRAPLGSGYFELASAAIVLSMRWS